MSEVPWKNAVSGTLSGSKVFVRESDEELVFYIPPPGRVRGWIAAIVCPSLLLAFWGFIALVFYEAVIVGGAPWFVLPFALFVALFIGLIAFIVLGFFFLALTQRYLNKTFVYITPEHLVLKTVLWGREEIEQHQLNAQSFARLYWGHPKLARRSEDIPRTPQGVEVVLVQDGERGSSPVFGDGLSWGEQEWIAWRINRFLGRASDDDAPEGIRRSAEETAFAVEDLPDEPLPPPEGIKVHIEEGVFETEFIFPNTMEMGTGKGIGSIVIGGSIAGFIVFHIIQGWNAGKRIGDIEGLIVTGTFGLIGLLAALMGLLRLFGRSRLKITPEKVTFRTTLCGIGPWARVPTAEILSVKRDAIRTTERTIPYGDQLCDATRDPAELEWLIGEIALRIHAARTGTAVPSIRHRSGKPLRRRVTPKRKPPNEPVPYDIHRRPQPTGRHLNTLLPRQVGPFRRDEFEEPEAEGSESIYVDYVSDQGKLFMEFAICPNDEDARKAVRTAHTEAAEGDAVKTFSLNTEPSFTRMTLPGRAFMAWNRGDYFFSVSIHGKNAERMLDAFMEAFPY